SLREVLGGGLLHVIALLLPWRLARGSRSDRVLVLLCASWFSVHVVFIFPSWDRYMLPLAAPLAVLAARGALLYLGRLRPRALQAAWCFMLLAATALPARAAMRDEVHIGRDYNIH